MEAALQGHICDHQAKEWGQLEQCDTTVTNEDERTVIKALTQEKWS